MWKLYKKSSIQSLIFQTKISMIPKIIHYCWFGNNPIPSEQQRYIEEWKQLMPDFQFKCWSEKDIDIASIPFAKQAYDAGKLAFVADYTRIYALYHEGGIYMDTDVKVLSSLEPYLKYGVFTSYEYNTSRDQMHLLNKMLTPDGHRKNSSLMEKIPGNGLLSALIGSEKGHPFIKDCLDFYNQSNNFNTIYEQKFTIPTVLALHAEKYGFVYIDKEQNLAGNIKIYDSGVFSDFHNTTSRSVAIHYCKGSWIEKNLFNRIKSKLYRIHWLRKLVQLVMPKQR